MKQPSTSPPRFRRPNQRPATGPYVLLVVFALLPALLLSGLWRWTSGLAAAAAQGAPTGETVAPPQAQPALSTSLLSLRRSANELSRRLNEGAFAQEVLGLGAVVGERSCAAVSIGGRLMGASNPELPVIPASNQKILVAAVAEHVLGADFTYETRVLGPAAVGGVITGDVYLVGGGDPLLSGDWYPQSGLERNPPFGVTSIDELARRVAAAGVTRIEGGVVGDGSRYDDEFYALGWGAGVADLEAGPYDALVANDARVRGEDTRAADPNRAAAREFIKALVEAGVTVTGAASTGVAASGTGEIASIRSQPLATVIAEMLTNSDNNTAELLVKELGVARGAGGSRVAGLGVIRDTLTSWKVDLTGVVLGDGSGLSLDNRLTCSALLDVLEHAAPTGVIADGLAVAGETGTLSKIFVDTDMQGRLRGKTGTLNNPPFNEDPPAVKALAGYLPVDGADDITYVLILNGPTISDRAEYRPVWAKLATVLATFPAVASPASLSPR